MSKTPDNRSRCAAMVPNPRLYDRLRQTPGLAKRTATIQARMVQVAVPR